LVVYTGRKWQQRELIKHRRVRVDGGVTGDGE
jgi:hypothetical protein